MRPQGIGRFFPAAFLSFWLCGWAAGEAFALWMLFQGVRALVTREPIGGHNPMPVPFILLMGAFLLF